MHSCNNPLIGKLAAQCGRSLPLNIAKSAAGFYIGTLDDDEDFQCPMPFTRESVEYWCTETEAREALDSGRWTQRRSL